MCRNPSIVISYLSINNTTDYLLDTNSSIDCILMNGKKALGLATIRCIHMYVYFVSVCAELAINLQRLGTVDQAPSDMYLRFLGQSVSYGCHV